MMADSSEIVDDGFSGLGGLLGPEGLAGLANNPKFQTILQRRMREMDDVRGPYESLPKPIKLRARALKNLQVKQFHLEAKFYEEVQKLEAKYQSLYQSLFDEREKIVCGKYEPTAEETNWPDSESEEEDDEGDKKGTNGDKAISSSSSKESKDNTKKGDNEQQDSAAGAAKPDAKENGVPSSSSDPQVDAKGIPKFWLTAMQNVDLFSTYIMDHDEPILEQLTDVKLVYKDTTGMDFDLEFHFADNDFFTNKVLTKHYKLTCEVIDDDPFAFEGATITKVLGCKIDWKKGKNITVKTIKKKQKHKGKNQSRTITKTVPNKSFFSFFSPPDPTTFESKEDEEEIEELAMQLDEDIARAEFLRDRLIPKAVLFFTGDALKDEEDDEDEMDGIDDDDDDDDSDLDHDYNAKADLQDSKPPECKNQ